MLSFFCIFDGMKVQLFDSKEQGFKTATITKATKIGEIPMKKDGWQFNWQSLYKTEGAEIYILCLEETPKQVEGMVMLSVMYEEMPYLHNIEVAPHNLGREGRYDNAAGCLLAYCCSKSFDLGKNAYEGYLVFDSKTELIPYYNTKYGAQVSIPPTMYFDRDTALILMKKYLR